MVDDFDSSTDVIRDMRDQPVDSLPPGIKGSLQIIHGPDRGRVFALQGGINIIGRGKESTVQLRGKAVSVRHAAVHFSQLMEWRINDLGSTNGTLLNGSKVKEFALRSGDKVSVGEFLLEFSER